MQIVPEVGAEQNIMTIVTIPSELVAMARYGASRQDRYRQGRMACQLDALACPALTVTIAPPLLPPRSLPTKPADAAGADQRQPRRIADLIE